MCTGGGGEAPCGRPHRQFKLALAVSVSVAQNIEPLTHVVSVITIIFIPDKEQKVPDSAVKYRIPGNPIFRGVHPLSQLCIGLLHIPPISTKCIDFPSYFR